MGRSGTRTFAAMQIVALKHCDLSELSQIRTFGPMQIVALKHRDLELSKVEIRTFGPMQIVALKHCEESCRWNACRSCLDS